MVFKLILKLSVINTVLIFILFFAMFFIGNKYPNDENLSFVIPTILTLLATIISNGLIKRRAGNLGEKIFIDFIVSIFSFGSSFVGSFIILDVFIKCNNLGCYFAGSALTIGIIVFTLISFILNMITDLILMPGKFKIK